MRQKNLAKRKTRLGRNKMAGLEVKNEQFKGRTFEEDKDFEDSEDKVENEEKELDYELDSDGEKIPVQEEVQLLEGQDEAFGPDQQIDLSRVALKEKMEIKEIRRKMKPVEIKAIEFDWIFSSTTGAGFMKTLISSKNIELFSIPLIQAIILFFWNHFKYRVLFFLFIPFLVYFIVFILYATWFQKRRVESEDGNVENFGLACTISAIILFCF